MTSRVTPEERGQGVDFCPLCTLLHDLACIRRCVMTGIGWTAWETKRLTEANLSFLNEISEIHVLLLVCLRVPHVRHHLLDAQLQQTTAKMSC